MLFREIIGQENIKRRLIQSVGKQRISHAQLFAGAEGSGNLALALAYARYVSCLNRQENDSCGQCISCKKYAKLVHPDLHVVFPVVRSSKYPKPVSDNFISQWREAVLKNPYLCLNDWVSSIGTGQLKGTIYVHESQEILRKLNLKTYESPYKIMLIWMPECMNIEAANKLLKILEEPPPKTLFLLVAETPANIIKTILSRAQLIKIPHIDNDSLLSALKQQDYGLPEDELIGIARVANGNYLKAQEILESNEENHSYFELFVQWMRFCYGKKIHEIIAWVEQLAKQGREKQKQFLNYALRLLRESYVLNKSPDKQNDLVYLTRDEMAFAKKFSPFITDANIHQLNSELNKAYFHIERNAADKIVLLDLSIKTIILLKAAR